MAAPIGKVTELLTDVHDGLEFPSRDCFISKGEYVYYHYGCGNFDDRGWGCGYRTLQSLSSWVKHQQEKMNSKPSHNVPSIPEIQEALVAIGDKPYTFKGSKDWIGSFEVCLCIDYFYDVPCKIIHVNSGAVLPNHIEDLVKHFQEYGAPVMMGGESDSSSKGVIGVCRNPQALLIMDPHYYGPTKSKTYLQKEGWVKWRLLEEFKEHSFYNLCLPQLKYTDYG
ncbi:ufm1-specific protease 1-like [Ruditapes philippinarum]|uniref:ufm1-specific protease 1-like n=1 Tax=Ruditapes philippinarum TaxID=129788 RepID=UPI00295C1DDD|nr:ufm1-specific protease 1-like [Ruditapes philippinarum]